MMLMKVVVDFLKIFEVMIKHHYYAMVVVKVVVLLEENVVEE
jgi:hypothetical protein